MKSFQLKALMEAMDSNAERSWMEFLRVDSLSIGLYRLKAGETDRQSPHSEDEVYYVVGGRGKFRAGTEERTAEAGAILYVSRYVEHRFFDIEEDLTVLVFFAPA